MVRKTVLGTLAAKGAATATQRPFRAYPIRGHPRDEPFLYLDPPYFKAPYYNHNMDLPDYEEMAAFLVGIKGKFILSINDTPEMRKVFQVLTVEPVTLKYSVPKEKGTTGKELMIRNFG